MFICAEITKAVILSQSMINLAGAIFDFENTALTENRVFRHYAGKLLSKSRLLSFVKPSLTIYNYNIMYL